MIVAMASILLFLTPTPLLPTTTSAPTLIGHPIGGSTPPQATLATGLLTLKALVSLSTYQKLGFTSIAEAQSAVLGVPVARYMVALRSLQAFNPSVDPKKLVVNSSGALYPVEVRGSTRSSIDFYNRAGAWHAEVFGRPNVIRALEVARQRDTLATHTSLGDYGLVAIPALGLSFLSVDTIGGLFLIPIFDNPTLGFQAGTRMSAQQVFLRLVPLARRNNGLPS